MNNVTDAITRQLGDCGEEYSSLVSVAARKHQMPARDGFVRPTADVLGEWAAVIGMARFARARSKIAEYVGSKRVDGGAFNPLRGKIADDLVYFDTVVANLTGLSKSVGMNNAQTREVWRSTATSEVFANRLEAMIQNVLTLINSAPVKPHRYEVDLTIELYSMDRTVIVEGAADEEEAQDAAADWVRDGATGLKVRWKNRSDREIDPTLISDVYPEEVRDAGDADR